MYKIKLKLAGRYRVNFNLPNCINKVLGFEKVLYKTDGKHKAPNIPDITSTQIYYIEINLIEPNILRKKNGQPKSLQYVKSYQTISKECQGCCNY